MLSESLSRGILLPELKFIKESKNLIGNLVKTKKPSEKNSDGDSISSSWRTSQTLGFFSSKSSPIHCVGGGEGNRTLVQKDIYKADYVCSSELLSQNED